MTRIMAAVLVMFLCAVASATTSDQQSDYQTDAYGYYYVITGGKFPNGQTVTGLKSTGGTMKYITDSPDWGGYTLDVWHADGWFTETAGLALTMKSGGATVYDNFNNDAGDFYTTPAGQASGDTPGLYRGYSMSNNFDWIYAGYFKLTEATTIDTIIGYFDETAGFDADNPNIRYRMNIWSSIWEDTLIMPAVDSFTGDVFTSDWSDGTFSWGDTGVDRVFGADYGNQTDDILYLQYTLNQPLVLAPGEYFFSHDAVIVPEPLTMLGMGLGLAGIGGYIRRRRSL